MHESSAVDVLRIVLATVAAYAIGYERQLRGARAGDRTYALVGLGGAVVGELALHGQPTLISGVLTGIGFLGAGLLIRPSANVVTGLSSAAAIIAVAAVGAMFGQGMLLVAGATTGLLLLLLEIPLLPGLRVLDAGRVAHHFADDPGHSPEDPAA
jgi:putative Mg2+ transporter-C (MgtC) family protein